MNSSLVSYPMTRNPVSASTAASGRPMCPVPTMHTVRSRSGMARHSSWLWAALQGGLHLTDDRLDDLGPVEGVGIAGDGLPVPVRAEGFQDGSSKRWPIAVGHENAVDAVTHDLRYAPDAGGDHGNAAGQ